MKKTFKEFKEFVMRGNILDLAVGVIIGGAFGKIVSSLVEDIFMPLIGMIIGGYSFENLVIKFGTAQIKYGVFIQNIVNFLIIAACVFTVVKIAAKFHKEEEKKPEVNEELETLKEIRDLLKKSDKKEPKARKATK